MKPEPKHELVVLKAADLSILTIYAGSADAREWIDREAPAFGTYFPFAQTPQAAPGSEQRAVLQVSPLFDVEEVRQYLETQGQEDK